MCEKADPSHLHVMDYALKQSTRYSVLIWSLLFQCGVKKQHSKNLS